MMTNDCTPRSGADGRERTLGAGGRAMLDLLLRRGQLPQARLPQLLDLSQPSVARLAGGFIAEGAISANARSATGRGNPSVMLALVSDHAFGLGIGITGDALSMAVVDFTGTARATCREPMQDRSPAAVLARLAKMRWQVLARAGVDQARLAGTGVGFSGFFVGDPPRFNPPEALAEWLDADFAALLAPVFGHDLLYDNDANCAAVAESLLGVGRTTDTFAYCHLTNGFGGALVEDGRLVRGSRGNAGDFGAVWWLLGRDRPAGGYPSLDRLRALVTQHGKEYPTVEAMLAELELATPGVDAWLREARGPFETLAFLLGHIVAPEKIVIGGRLPRWLANALSEAVELPASPVRHQRPFPLPAVVAAEVDGDATAIGAALMPLRKAFFR